MVPMHSELWFTSHIQRSVFETQLINSPEEIGLCHLLISTDTTQCFPVNDLTQAPKTT